MPPGDPGYAYVPVSVWTGTPERGVWCMSCALPSGICVPLYLVSIHGVSMAGSVKRCNDCGTPL